MIEAIKNWLHDEAKIFDKADMDFATAERIEQQIQLYGSIGGKVLEEYRSANVTRIQVFQRTSAAFLAAGSALLFGASRSGNNIVKTGLAVGGLGLMALGTAQGVLGEACVLQDQAIKGRTWIAKEDLAVAA